MAQQIAPASLPLPHDEHRRQMKHPDDMPSPSGRRVWCGRQGTLERLNFSPSGDLRCGCACRVKNGTAPLLGKHEAEAHAVLHRDS